MKKLLIALICFLVSIANASELNIRESELSTRDLASFMGVKHKTFVLEHDGSVRHISYQVNIYKNGEVINWQSPHGDSTSSVREPVQRFSILYKDEGFFMRVVVVKNGMTSRFDVEKPKGVDGFPLAKGGIKFDEEGRLVLAFDIEKNEEGASMITPENSTVEGAKAALVFRIEME